MTKTATPHFRIAWRAFIGHPRVLVTSMVVLFASWVCLEVAVVALHRWGVIFNVFLHFAFLLLFAGLTTRLVVISNEVLNGQEAGIGSLADSLERGPQALLAFCLYVIGVAAGLILLVVPGVYFAVRCALFGMVVATREVSAIESLRAAGSLSQGRWWGTCSFFLKVLALNLVGAALLGLGLLVSVPVSILATGSYYRSLELATED